MKLSPSFIFHIRLFTLHVFYVQIECTEIFLNVKLLIPHTFKYTFGDINIRNIQS